MLQAGLVGVRGAQSSDEELLARQLYETFSNRTNGHTQVYPDYVRTRTNVSESRTSSSFQQEVENGRLKGKTCLYFSKQLSGLIYQIQKFFIGSMIVFREHSGSEKKYGRRKNSLGDMCTINPEIAGGKERIREATVSGIRVNSTGTKGNTLANVKISTPSRAKRSAHLSISSGEQSE
ncbi:hypothetical protein CBL_03191 [Carabus blaptoides fortunei]